MLICSEGIMAPYIPSAEVGMKLALTGTAIIMSLLNFWQLVCHRRKVAKNNKLLKASQGLRVKLKVMIFGKSVAVNSEPCIFIDICRLF